MPVTDMNEYRRRCWSAGDAESAIVAARAGERQRRFDAAMALAKAEQVPYQCPPCNGNCSQGRACNARLHPAEACTDIRANAKPQRSEFKRWVRAFRWDIFTLFCASCCASLLALRWTWQHIG